MSAHTLRTQLEGTQTFIRTVWCVCVWGGGYSELKIEVTERSDTIQGVRERQKIKWKRFNQIFFFFLQQRLKKQRIQGREVNEWRADRDKR